ncbi:MAG: hypothetical protein AB7O90_19640, partial [Hyphomicrobium sp.]
KNLQRASRSRRDHSRERVANGPIEQRGSHDWLISSIFNGLLTVLAGTNGVLATGGVGPVAGALALTGFGFDFRFPISIEGELCH